MNDSSGAFMSQTSSRKPSGDEYLNEFHRQNEEAVKRSISSQPKRSREEALAQYDRIKRESGRNSRKDQNGAKPI